MECRSSTFNIGESLFWQTQAIPVRKSGRTFSRSTFDHCTRLVSSDEQLVEVTEPLSQLVYFCWRPRNLYVCANAAAEERLRLSVLASRLLSLSGSTGS